MIAESALRVPWWVRVWHWTTALLFVPLIATGIVLHFATPGFEPIPYATATTVHDVAGILLAIAYGIYLPIALVSGHWREYLPARRGLWSRVRGELSFQVVGTVRGERPPAGVARFNPLQQLAYSMIVFLVLPSLTVSGLLYLYPEEAPRWLGLEVLWPLAATHYALGVLATVFFILHVYMGVLGPGAAVVLRRMTRGHADANG
jgi:thiosulfate reductase cytochrome b subunit